MAVLIIESIHHLYYTITPSQLNLFYQLVIVCRNAFNYLVHSFASPPSLAVTFLTNY